MNFSVEMSRFSHLVLIIRLPTEECVYARVDMNLCSDTNLLDLPSICASGTLSV